MRPPSGLIETTIAAAIAARERAYAPYSRFRVGAAIATSDGRINTGANVENASYGLTACAERVAIWSAVAAGLTDFSVVVVATDTSEPVSPCGACRQVLAELAPEAAVVMVTVGGTRRQATVAELLPGAFGSHDLAR